MSAVAQSSRRFAVELRTAIAERQAALEEALLRYDLATTEAEIETAAGELMVIATKADVIYQQTLVAATQRMRAVDEEHVA